MVLNIDDHAQQIDLLKPCFVYGDLILSGHHAGKHIDSCVIRGSCGDGSTFHTLELDLCPRHNGTRFVRD